ncbi:PP2C family protein-serine/threonine phosphatase [Candidatus Gracilibacteria bacterium]|nr:PP2C family protein-serine/threonine phosphatase [Candidatus Gracilibacteria bacterium]
MLSVVVSSHHNQLTAIADVWLSEGASSFSIWQRGQLLRSWPAVPGDTREVMLTVPICIDENIVGELRVSGTNGSKQAARLAADADLVAALVKLEDELTLMTAELVNSQDQQVALYRLTRSMSGMVSVEETLNSLLCEAIRLSHASGGYVVFMPASGAPLVLHRPEVMLSEANIWQCFWQAQMDEQEIIVTPTDRSGTRLALAEVPNMLFIPLRTRGVVNVGLGLLKPVHESFSNPDIKLMRAICDHASAQVEKALLYQESFEQARMRTEMELARRVQLDLLPRHLPLVPGLDIYAHTRPAMHVGGDFYDFIQHARRPFFFTVGDVTGKGLSAALLMTMTRTAIHSKASFMPDPTPETVMRQSNADLYDDFTQVGVFATAFIGQYLAAERRIRYANAGHSPVIYRPREGPATMLRADSTAIGVLPASSSRNYTLRITEGDLLIVATDGFSDARDHNNERFDYDRLLALTEEVAQRSAREIVDAIYEAVDTYGSGRPQDDDQTILVIKGASLG